MKKLIVVIGLPGSGKDTQIELIQNNKDVEVLRVGDLIRDLAKKDSEIEKAISNGDLVNDKKVNDMVDEKIKSYQPNSMIISDGFPRRLSQAEWLEEYAKENSIEIDKYLLLKITDEESMKRLLKRGRSDDTEEVISHRIDIFHQETNEVIDFYKSRNKYVEVDGIGSVEEIHERMKDSLGW